VKHSRPRYVEPWMKPWEDRVAREMRPGMTILDVGSGRRPTIPPGERPPSCTYVGLDLSMDELQAAPEGSYDESICGDVAGFLPALEASFDVVLAWQVLEHVRPLEAAVDNIHRYLVPGGTFLGHLSGRFSLFALLNSILPHRLGVWGMEHLLGRDHATIFPAQYDQCWHGALERILSDWDQAEVVSRYRGSGYFRFFGPLERAYLVYEDWTVRHPNLATHYLISARG